MKFSVSIKAGRCFEVDADESILAAALRQNITLPFGCKNGACGSCKARIISGQCTHADHGTALLMEERADGMALLCCTYPCSDIVLAYDENQNLALPKKYLARIARIHRVSDDVIILHLQLPQGKRFSFFPGQYIELLLKNGQSRCYSIASPPHQMGSIELHLRHMQGGLFTDRAFASSGGLKERDLLQFEAPLGNFYLRERSNKPIILLASGTGIAPIKAIIETIIFKKIEREITLYWGGRKKDDLYLHQQCLQWEQEQENFRYIPVLSEAKAADFWTGRTGFVHHAVMTDFPNLSSCQIYACGSPIMVAAAREDFIRICNLPAEEFFADAFLPALKK